MNIYVVSQGDPEGTDYSLMMMHEKLFTRDEFQAVCEQAMVYALEEQCKEPAPNFVSLSCLDSGILFKKLKEVGFVEAPVVTSYYLEPYWGSDRIKNPALLEWADGKEYTANESPVADKQKEEQGA